MLHHRTRPSHLLLLAFVLASGCKSPSPAAADATPDTEKQPTTPPAVVPASSTPMPSSAHQDAPSQPTDAEADVEERPTSDLSHEADMEDEFEDEEFEQEEPEDKEPAEPSDAPVADHDVEQEEPDVDDALDESETGAL